MEGRFRVGFCVSGQGRLARSAIKYADAIGIDAALVIADHTAATDLEDVCRARAVRSARIPKLPREGFDRELFAVLTAEPLDLVCLTFDRIVAAPLVDYYGGRIINVHPGLLPAFAGTKALQRAEHQGVRFAGATIHEVVGEVDAGPIIAQCVVGLEMGEQYSAFGAKIYKLLQPMFLQTLNWYASGRVFKDESGKIWIRDAVYGELPVSPAIEMKFEE